MKNFKKLNLERFLKWIEQQGLSIDYKGGHKEDIKFSVLQKINNKQYIIDTNHKKTINCFSGEKFTKTIQKIEKQTQVTLFK